MSVDIDEMSLLSFTGGLAVGAVGDADSAHRIIDSLAGLGEEQFLNSKRATMLANPMVYINGKNTALAALKTSVSATVANNGIYATTLAEVNAALPAAWQDSEFAKRYATQQAANKALMRKELIDLEWPMEKKAEKDRKAVNDVDIGLSKRAADVAYSS